MDATSNTLAIRTTISLTIPHKKVELTLGPIKNSRIFYLNDKSYIRIVTDIQNQKIYLFDSSMRTLIPNFPGSWKIHYRLSDIGQGTINRIVCERPGPKFDHRYKIKREKI